MVVTSYLIYKRTIEASAYVRYGKNIPFGSLDHRFKVKCPLKDLPSFNSTENQ